MTGKMILIKKGRSERQDTILAPGDKRDYIPLSDLVFRGMVHTYRGLIRASIVCVEVDKQFFVCSIVVYYE